MATYVGSLFRFSPVSAKFTPSIPSFLVSHPSPLFNYVVGCVHHAPDLIPHLLYLTTFSCWLFPSCSRVLRRQQKTIDALTEVVQTQARTIADLVASTASASKPSLEAKKVLPRDDIDIAVEIAAYGEEDVGAHRLLNRADDPARGEGDR